MTRLVDIESHMASMGELLDIVGAMRSLAGIRMQEAQRALPGIRLYAQWVARGLADVLSCVGTPEPVRNNGAKLALIVCTAEHGFVGGFNERLVGVAQAALGPDDELFVLGSRGAALAFERGQHPRWTHPMATRCSAAPEMVQQLSTELYTGISRGEIGRVEVVYAPHTQSGPPSIERRLLLPLDLTLLAEIELRQPPLYNLDPAVLLERLMAEYVFARLTEAAVESITSENVARLAAMESAHENVSKKLEQLRQDARLARQAEITAELLELVTATQAARPEA